LFDGENISFGASLFISINSNNFPKIIILNRIYDTQNYLGAGKSLARPASRYILFDCENISFGASLFIYIYINSINIPPIVIINKIYETQNLLSL
jgi:hypothetical protein